MPSLLRLFQENSSSQDHHLSGDLEWAAIQPNIDPWHAILRVASESREGFSKSLQWLCLLARSGIDIPRATFMQFSALAKHYDSGLTDSLLFVKAVFHSTWLKSLGRQELQVLFSELHVRLAPRIINWLKCENEARDR